MSRLMFERPHVPLAVLSTLVALLLSGCGNTPTQGQGWKTYGGILMERWEERRGTVPESDPAKTARLVQNALSTVDEPIMLAVMDETKRTALIAEFGRNGAYRTYRTSSMQEIIFRDGVLVGTRGFGYDLLSSDATPSIALIRGRRAGEVSRVYRHLSGDNHSVPTAMSCKISNEGVDKVAQATGRTISATRMKEVCTAGALRVRNTYWVTGSGEIAQSIQWISPEVGKVALQTLRN